MNIFLSIIFAAPLCAQPAPPVPVSVDSAAAVAVVAKASETVVIPAVSSVTTVAPVTSAASAPAVVVAKPVSAKSAGPDAEWEFVKATAADSSSAGRDAAIENLRLFTRRYPESEHAPDALCLLAGLRAEKGDWQAAAVDLLRVIYEYAGSPVEVRAKSGYLDLVKGDASRRQRPILNDFVNTGDEADKSDRLSALWQKIAAQAPDAFYEPAAEEIHDFLVRFPDHKSNDKLQAALARLHAANDKPTAGAVAWSKLLALYPDSGVRPAAQLAIGDLYADPLRDAKKAIDVYQNLIAQYPQAPEVQPALQNCARLFEEKLKQYDLAVQMDEQIVKLFPKTVASLQALKGMARLRRDRLSKPDAAITTLLRLSTMHGGQDGVDALLLAAEIARHDLKDYGRQAALLHQVSDDYPTVKEAPQALYDAAGVYEGRVQDIAKAIAAYKEVASKYPNHKLARKASDRAARLSAAS